MLDRSINMIRSIRTPKCLGCIPVETGCFIFGVFGGVISGVSILSLCFLMNSVTAAMKYAVETDSFDDKAVIPLIYTYVAVVLVYLCSLLAFIFSVFLCYGVQKRRPGFVKAYLVYGIVKTVVLMLAAVLYSSLVGDLVGGSLILIGCGMYSLVLLMVHRTYALFCAEALLTEAEPLESKPMKA